MSRYIGEDIGGYRIIEPIGSGGMARVFKAYQPAFDRFVALKVLPEHYAEDATYVERFKQEARIIARLEHRHILPVYDFGQEGGITFLAMRYLRAGTLKDVLARSGGRLSFPDTVRLISQISSALDYAHGQGIIHRDVKPSNVLVDSGDAYLMDFGIAKILEATEHLTATGGAMGTPAYMSPEQGAGRKVDARSDVYSLGILLYEMLTGRVPFEAETPLAVLLAHSNEPLPLPSTLNPDIPEEVENVIFKALAKNPNDRYASAGSLANALGQAVPAGLVAQDDGGDLLALSAELAGGKPSDQVTRDVRIAAKKKPRVGRGVSPILLGGVAVIIIGLIAAVILLLSTTSDPTRAIALVQQVTQTAQARRDATATQARYQDMITGTVLAHTPSATPTPTVPPTATPTPEYIEGKTLYQDDFEGGDLSKWGLMLDRFE